MSYFAAVSAHRGMAKKKPASKKSSNGKPTGKATPSKKASSNDKAKTSTKASSSSKKTDVKTATKTLAKPNGTSSGGKKTVEAKTSTKKIAGGGGNEGLQHFKAKANGTQDDKGLNPQTYQMLRQDIISTLWKYDEITLDELSAAMEKIHGKNFVSASLKYIQQVVSDLINIDLIEQIDRDTNRSIYRIRQRLSE
jgi:hypothetical protein